MAQHRVHWMPEVVKKGLRKGKPAIEISYCKITAWATLCASHKSYYLTDLFLLGEMLYFTFSFSVRMVQRMHMIWILLSISLPILDLNKGPSSSCSCVSQWPWVGEKQQEQWPWTDVQEKVKTGHAYMNFHPKTFLASNYFSAQEAALRHIQVLGMPGYIC